jgi:hypothetical protein
MLIFQCDTKDCGHFVAATQSATSGFTVLFSGRFYKPSQSNRITQHIPRKTVAPVSNDFRRAEIQPRATDTNRLEQNERNRMKTSSLGMAGQVLAGLNGNRVTVIGLLVVVGLCATVTFSRADALPPAGGVKIVGPSVRGPSITLSVGNSIDDSNAPPASKTTNTVVSAIQAQLKAVVEGVEAATRKMTNANGTGPKEQAAAVEELADRIDTLAKKDIGDNSQFLTQADQLIKKMEGQIKLAQDRASDPNILPSVQQQYSETAKRIRESLTQLRSAREAVNGVRSDLMTQAQGLRERKDFLGFVADAEIGISAADAFKQCLTDIHNFCRRLEATIAGLDGNTPFVVENKVIN